jgi:hypothetical protein
MKTLDDIIAYYSLPDLAEHGGPQMLEFLELVSPLLRTRELCYTTSHHRLGIAKSPPSATSFPLDVPYVWVYVEASAVSSS